MFTIKPDLLDTTYISFLVFFFISIANMTTNHPPRYGHHDGGDSGHVVRRRHSILFYFLFVSFLSSLTLVFLYSPGQVN